MNTKPVSLETLLGRQLLSGDISGIYETGKKIKAKTGKWPTIVNEHGQEQPLDAATMYTASEAIRESQEKNQEFSSTDERR